MERYIGAPDNPPSRDKDIGDSEVKSLTCTAARPESDEQKILQQIKKVIGDNTVSERRLKFAPQWIIDEAIAKEKDNYDGCFEEVKIKDLPKDANFITAHHFFQLKSQGYEWKAEAEAPTSPTWKQGQVQR